MTAGTRLDQLLSRRSIRTKMLIVMTTVSLLALLLAAVTFTAISYYELRQRLLTDMRSLAAITGNNCHAALAFNIPEDAARMLAELARDERVSHAWILRTDGSLFIGFPSPDQLPHAPHDGFVEVVTPIAHSGTRLGEIVLHASLVDVHATLQHNLAVFAVTGCVALLLVFLLAGPIQGLVSDPILRLANAARRVAETHDYSMRVPAVGEDETALLTRTFNEMLERIRQQQADLQEASGRTRQRAEEAEAARGELEKEVAIRQRAEREVRTLNQELEDRVEQRTAELAATLRELETFSYSVSHDLRTPLRAIDGFSQSLVDDCADRLTPTEKDYLFRIRKAAQRMSILIDDLLRLARITRHDLREDAINLSALVLEILDARRERDPTRNVEWEVTPGLHVRGDANLVQIALENLVDNAWKFTRGRDPARIVLERVGPGVFRLRDNGVGFDPAYARKMFQPFQRFHRAAEFEGVGVGLATVARVLHRHGGWIRAESSVGNGAAFTFSFQSPIEPLPREASHLAVASGHTGEPA